MHIRIINPKTTFGRANLVGFEIKRNFIWTAPKIKK